MASIHWPYRHEYVQAAGINLRESYLATKDFFRNANNNHNVGGVIGLLYLLPPHTDEDRSLTDAISFTVGTAVNSPTYDPVKGSYDFDGSTNYVNTNVVDDTTFNSYLGTNSVNRPMISIGLENETPAAQEGFVGVTTGNNSDSTYFLCTSSAGAALLLTRGSIVVPFDQIFSEDRYNIFTIGYDGFAIDSEVQDTASQEATPGGVSNLNWFWGCLNGVGNPGFYYDGKSDFLMILGSSITPSNFARSVIEKDVPDIVTTYITRSGKRAALTY